MSGPGDFIALLAGDPRADRVVPPSGHTARLTVFAAAAMAFLAVFALALAVSAGRLADKWAGELAQSSTIRISAPADQIEAQTALAMAILEQTPGVATARVLSNDEQRALLAPWFGPELPLESLPIPQLVEVIEDDRGYDAESLRLRLQAEVPGAILDDHTRWRRPLSDAADRLRTLSALSIALIAATTAVIITLAASSALAANANIIGALRLVGARDAYIVRAFVRRFTLRTLVGASIGTVIAMAAVAVLPPPAESAGFLTGLGFNGAEWLWPLAIPPVAGLVSFLATRTASFRQLGEIT